MLKCHILFDAIKLAFTKYTEFLLLIIKLENSSILKCDKMCKHCFIFVR